VAKARFMSLQGVSLIRLHSGKVLDVITKSSYFASNANTGR